MRIIAGISKGRRLKTPNGLNTRPTTDRVKESIFSMINPYLYNSIVLDLFSGTGNLGLEALSRGAEKAYFVDNNKTSFLLIKENVENLGFQDHSTVLFCDAMKAIKDLAIKKEKIHIIFMDPPYLKGHIVSCINAIDENELLFSHGIVVVEHDTKDILPEVIGRLHRTKEKKYGNTNISIYSEEA